MTFQHLRLDISDQIGTITLDRPEKLNALSRDLHNEMVAAANQLQADDDVRVVIVTGAGRGFCSGADLTARPRDNAPDTQNDRMDEYGWVGHQALAFGHLDKPTIAAVNGVAAGAGMSLALSCDLRVGSEQARFKVVFLEPLVESRRRDDLVPAARRRISQGRRAGPNQPLRRVRRGVADWSDQTNACPTKS